MLAAAVVDPVDAAAVVAAAVVDAAAVLEAAAVVDVDDGDDAFVDEAAVDDPPSLLNRPWSAWPMLEPLSP